MVLTLTSSRQCCSRWPSVSGPLDVAMKVLKMTEGSYNFSLDYGRSDARIVENGFAASSGVSKSAKVVLGSLRSLRNPTHQPADQMPMVRCASLMRAHRNAVHLLVQQHSETKRKHRSNTAELACATIGAEESAVYEAAHGRTDAIRLCGFRAPLVLDAAHRRLRRLRSARAGRIAVVLPAPRAQQRRSHASAGERRQGRDFGGQDRPRHPDFVVRGDRRDEAFGDTAEID